MGTIRAIDRVLVALDFSPHSARVLDRVALLPLVRSSRVTLLHIRPPAAVDPGGRDAHGAAVTLADTAAENLRGRFGPLAPRVESSLARGVPVRVIATKARALGAELIVLGRRGASPIRRLALGSTAEGILHAGIAPVLVVAGVPEGYYRNPIAGVDTRPAARDLLREVRRLLPSNTRAVTLVHAFEPSWGHTVPGMPASHLEEAGRRERETAAAALARLADYARDQELPVRTRLRDGDPREVLIGEARDLGADLIALASRGRGRAARRLLGSVTASVLRDATCDVFVVPPPRSTGRGA